MATSSSTNTTSTSSGIGGLPLSGPLSTTPSTQTVVAPNAVSAPLETTLANQANALLQAPYQAYTGQLTSGPSNLQNQAWQGLSSSGVPSQLSSAASQLGDTAAQIGNISSTFNPEAFTNTYTSPGAYNEINATNQYASPQNLSANVNFTNQFTNPGAYNGIQASTEAFTPQAAQQLMNPYLQASLAPQLQLLQQQLGTQNAASNAQLAQAGAYGGGRQAVVNAQNALNSNLAANQLISSGYNTAYNNAMNQFNADQARSLQAQQANIGQQQFGANLGMTAAEQAATYGQQALNANAQQQQFNVQQALANAQNVANYGNQAQAANIQQQQFKTSTGLTEAQQAAQALQAQQAAQEAQRQYQSNLALQGLQGQTSALQAQANAGTNISTSNLANLNALANAGATQQQLNQAALNAQYNQYLAQQQYPQTMLKLGSSVLTGLPGNTTSTYGATPSTLQSILGTAGGVTTLMNNLLGEGYTKEAAQNFIKRITTGGTGAVQTPTGITSDPATGAYYDAATGLPLSQSTDANGTTLYTDSGGQKYYDDGSGNLVPYSG